MFFFLSFFSLHTTLSFSVTFLFVSVNHYFSFVKHLGFGGFLLVFVRVLLFPISVSEVFGIGIVFFILFLQSFQPCCCFLLLVGIDWLVNQERNIRDTGNQRQK